jgi:hypothetical protein
VDACNDLWDDPEPSVNGDQAKALVEGALDVWRTAPREPQRQQTQHILKVAGTVTGSLTQRDTAAAAAAAAAAVVADVSISVAAIHPKAMQLQFGAGRNVCPIRIRKQLRYTRSQDIRTVRYLESQHIWTVRIFEQSGHTHSLAS